MHATVRDVSEHGVMLAMPTRVAPGSQLALEFGMAGGTDPGLIGQIVWSDDAHAGMRFDFETPEQRSAWSRVLDEAIEAFGKRLVVVKRATDRPSLRG